MLLAAVLSLICRLHEWSIREVLNVVAHVHQRQDPEAGSLNLMERPQQEL